jgi:hypothetical protein
MLTLLFLFTSCIHGIEVRKLSGGYYYHNAGRESKYILPPSVASSPSHMINFLKKYIFSLVVAFEYNDEFIVAAQKPIEEEFYSQMGWELDVIYRQRRRCIDVTDSIIKNDPYFQKILSRKLSYWIIYHKNDSVYGPLTAEEYKGKYKTLKMPEKFNFSKVFKSLE